MHAIGQRWLTMVLVGLLAGAAGFGLVWLLMPAKYTAVALLHISGRSRGGYESEGDFVNYVKTQESLLKSHQVIRALLDKTDIQELREIQSQSDPVLWLQKELVSDTKLGQEVLRVTLNGDNPEDTTRILNTLLAVYLQEFVNKHEARVAERMKQLKNQFDKLSNRQQETKLKLQALRQALGLEDPETYRVRLGTLMGQLTAYQNKLVDLTLKRKELEADLESQKKQLELPQNVTVSQFLVDKEMRSDTTAAALITRLLDIDRQIVAHKKVDARLGSPAVQALLNEQQGIEGHLALHRKTLESTLRLQAIEDLKTKAVETERQIHLNKEGEKNLHLQVKDLERALARQSSKDAAPERTTAEVESLADEVKQLNVALDKISQELAELQTEAAVTPRVTLQEPAQVPTAKNTDRNIKFAAISGVGMFGLALFGVAFMEFRSRKVYAPEDVVRDLGLNLVGTLPDMPPRARQGSVQASAGGAAMLPEQGVMMESVDAIRTVLLHEARNEIFRVLLVTSAGTGEGKTSLACHLAASLARGGRKTLLIDGDLRNPAVHKQFDLPQEPGFGDVLRGGASWTEVIRETGLDHLSVIPAGQGDRLAIKALAQGDLGGLFEPLREEFDFIILDSCPVLAVADAMMLSQQADAVLFSVLRNVSRLPAVYAAQQRLTALGIRILGTVVTGDKLNTYGAKTYPVQRRS